MEDQIDMIACGALRPLALQPGEVQEISSAYVIKGGPAPGSEVGVTYEIKQESQGVYSKPNAPTRTTAKAN
jgi:hypothetical protein